MTERAYLQRYWGLRKFVFCLLTYFASPLPFSLNIQKPPRASHSSFLPVSFRRFLFFFKPQYNVTFSHPPNQSTPLWPFALRRKPHTLCTVCKLKRRIFSSPFSFLILLTQRGEDTAVLLGGLHLEEKKKSLMLLLEVWMKCSFLLRHRPRMSEWTVHGAAGHPSASLSFSHHSVLFLVIFTSWCFYCSVISHCFSLSCVRSPICGSPPHHPLPHFVSSHHFVVSSIWSLS